MKNSLKSSTIILTVVLVAAISFLIFAIQRKHDTIVYDNFSTFVSVDDNSLKPGHSYNIKKIVVRDATSYFLILSEGKDYFPVRLDLDCESLDVTDKVVRILNLIKNPKAKLKEKQGQAWIGEIIFDLNDKQLTMTTWLKENNFILQ